MKNKIKALFFDLGNVLVMFDAGRALKKFSKAFHVSEEVLWKELFQSDLERAYTRGEISSEDFFKGLKKKFPNSLSFEEFEHIWNDIFWKNEGMEELVEELSESYKLYLISNTNRLHFDYIKKNFPVLKHFDICFPSHEVGSRKPDPEIYYHVLQKTGFKPEEIIYTDDVAEFIQTARDLGIQSVLFASKDQFVSEMKKLGVHI